MSDSSSADRPSWVHKSDGRLVPFDADAISRDLFAATESLGQPDVFLARELTDGIVHFLTVEGEASVPTTAQIVEIGVKVVRELGYPKLAHAFGQQGARRERRSAGAAEKSRLGSSDNVQRVVSGGVAPSALAWSLSRDCLRAYSLQTVYARDIAAAHSGGLLVLGSLDTPLELAGYVPAANEVRDAANLAERLWSLRSIAGELVALDGPDYTLTSAAQAAEFGRQLRFGLEATNLRAVVNLNCILPPSGAGRRIEGPLFSGQSDSGGADQRLTVAEALLDCLLAAPAPLRIDWHLAAGDFQLEAKGRLLRLARRAVDTTLAFVFDRPRRPVHLAEGLDQQHPATLMTIGLNLPKLAGQAGVQGQTERFLDKVGSLVRLALSAATQRRDFLRCHSGQRPALMAGFLLERARLVLTPIGLEAVIRRLSGRGLCDGGAGAELGRQIVQRLDHAVREESRHRYLESCLDSAGSLSLEEHAYPATEQAAGLTSWDAQIPLRHQVRAAGQLQAVTKTGTAVVLLSPEQVVSAEQIGDLLQLAWRETEIARLRLVRLPATAADAPALWQE